ncbi:Phospholipid/cholesterol/gamma-HCH transport system substrate-binding protein OS=Castellaniella defragrans OX=75697 GN=HNR28_002092 PE=4 SV=1 [Castellaniella defragrans]
MTRDKTDFWVGLFILLGLIALVFLALRAGNMSSFSFAPTYRVQAYFDNVGGLKVRAPIKSSGVVVGRVASIGFDNKRFQAVVAMDLQQPYQFPDDTSASILTSGLLGEQYVGLTPGGDDKNLKDGSTVQFTQSAVVLEDLISKFLYNSAEKQGTAGQGGQSTSGGDAAAPAAGAPGKGAATPAPSAPASPAQ